MVPYAETLRDVLASLDKAVREQLVREGFTVDIPRLLSQLLYDEGEAVTLAKQLW